jgi:uncharacterized protein
MKADKEQKRPARAKQPKRTAKTAARPRKSSARFPAKAAAKTTVTRKPKSKPAANAAKARATVKARPKVKAASQPAKAGSASKPKTRKPSLRVAGKTLKEQKLPRTPVATPKPAAPATATKVGPASKAVLTKRAKKPVDKPRATAPPKAALPSASPGGVSEVPTQAVTVAGKAGPPKRRATIPRSRVSAAAAKAGLATAAAAVVTPKAVDPVSIGAKDLPVVTSARVTPVEARIAAPRRHAVRLKLPAKPAPKRSRRPAAEPLKPASPAPRAKTSRSQVELPAILFETVPPPPAPPKPAVSAGSEPGELPESYGTERLTLCARDPYCLVAAWDLEPEKQRRFNAISRDRHLILRVFEGGISGRLHCEVRPHPESRHWFIHVGRAGTTYAVQLGLYTRGGEWLGLTTSAPATTPPDRVVEEESALRAALPVEAPLPELAGAAQAEWRLAQPLAAEPRIEPPAPTPAQTPAAPAVPVSASAATSPAAVELPLLEMIRHLREQGAQVMPQVELSPAPSLPLEVAQWIAEVIAAEQQQRGQAGSLEIVEWLRSQIAAGRAAGAGPVPGGEALNSLAAGQFSLPTGEEAPTSPGGGLPVKPRGFWFNVNAELVIYGATEPDATATICGRHIKLRPDGSFSFRFALPDGNYALPAQAVSGDGAEARRAELHFQRTTHYTGDVGAHPQDAMLKPPKAEHVA